MNLLDILFSVILIFGLIRGLMVGLVRQVASIAGLVVGGYVAYFYYPEISSFLATWIQKATYRNVISFILVFISVYLIIVMVAHLLQFLIKISMTGWLNRLLGMALGLLKGAIICALVLIVLELIFPSKAAFLKSSVLAPYVQIVADTIRQTISS